MKKYFRWSILLKAVLLIAVLSALLALINLALYDGGTFRIGNTIMGDPGDAKYGLTRPQMTEAFTD